ncbi:MAG: hypothetical protein U5R06_09730 [candidate division KSB1 bacterium]|nr:hypothetical protein [candidate division KSB1 bacterium]
MHSELVLEAEAGSSWYMVADLNQDQSDVAGLQRLLASDTDLVALIENEIDHDRENLRRKIARSDGFQLTQDDLGALRHTSNVLFNIMRGGIFEDSYYIQTRDFKRFIKTANQLVFKTHQDFLHSLPETIELFELRDQVGRLNDIDLERLLYEYLPLSFSRRHGDPSRPWNRFSIKVKDETGEKSLNYQGNWRDIFQNWEALALSFPGYLEHMITKFVNSMTADGYNPYRVLRDGFDWEVPDTNAWSNIGYWGDHQIVYLLKLLELSFNYHPEHLKALLSRDMFTYARVPYRIKPYQSLVHDPHRTIEFDHQQDSDIRADVAELGEDGKYLLDEQKQPCKVNLFEKLLVPVLVKLCNFVPEAGIWMNTQRPEWNDANNALVGYGTSMVTLYYLRRYTVFVSELLQQSDPEELTVSGAVHSLYHDLYTAFKSFEPDLNGTLTDARRKEILNELGAAGEQHRKRVYENDWGNRDKVKKAHVIAFLGLALHHLDHSISMNRRSDDLFHSYNLIRFNNNEGIEIRHLYEMLEGQVSVLSSGYLCFEDSIILLNSLRKSKLYRKDQDSYLLYPERSLPDFMEKNNIPDEQVKRSELLKTLLKKANEDIVKRDPDGQVHFAGTLGNAGKLEQALEQLDSQYRDLASREKSIVLDIYESVFDHQSFTGRSGTFYKYEGLGSIYWHMVSKLALAVQDVFYRALEDDADRSILDKLKNYYYEIRYGIGSHKSPDLYGAFPTDPYSHTPRHTGVQQPGMTGQVKEDIISRFGELGVCVRKGKISFHPDTDLGFRVFKSIQCV